MDELTLHWKDGSLSKTYLSEEYLWDIQSYGVVIRNKETPNNLTIFPWHEIEAVTLIGEVYDRVTVHD